MRILFLVLLLVPAAAGLEWHVPEEGRAGHPIHATWTAGPGPYETHVDAEVAIHENGMLVFSTASVHEHDGVHTLTYTPRGAGEVTFTAGEDVASVSVAPRHASAPGQDVWLDDVDGELVLAPAWAGSAHVALRDADGRALLTTWTAPATGVVPAGLGQAFARAVATSSDAADAPTLGLVETTLRSYAPPRGGALVAVPSTCGLVTDPNSHGAALSWQEGTTVRVTHFGAGEASYALAPAGGAAIWRARSVHPQAAIAFTAPGPGHYDLHFQRGADACTLTFEVLTWDGQPSLLQALSTPPAPGRVDAELSVRGDTLAFTLTPLADEVLTHYEFDTMVYRADATDGRLVWAGKLHGHGGPVSATLAGLEPGRYSIVTYPSPQDVGTPTVASDEQGFRWDIDVLPTAAQSAPVPLLAMLALLVAVRRR